MTQSLDTFFKFCPSCKSPLLQRERRLVDCKTCGFHFYWNTSPTAGALLKNKKGELLFVERKAEPKKGYWDIPGGFIEADETFEQAVRREIGEELDVTLGEIEYIGSSTDVYEYRGITYNTVVAVFTGFIEGKISPSDDVASARFFPKNKLPFAKFAFPGLAKLIEKYLENSDK